MEGEGEGEGGRASLKGSYINDYKFIIYTITYYLYGYK